MRTLGLPNTQWHREDQPSTQQMTISSHSFSGLAPRTSKREMLTKMSLLSLRGMIWIQNRWRVATIFKKSSLKINSKIRLRCTSSLTLSQWDNLILRRMSYHRPKVSLLIDMLKVSGDLCSSSTKPVTSSAERKCILITRTRKTIILLSKCTTLMRVPQTRSRISTISIGSFNGLWSRWKRTTMSWLTVSNIWSMVETKSRW